MYENREKSGSEKCEVGRSVTLLKTIRCGISFRARGIPVVNVD